MFFVGTLTGEEIGTLAQPAIARRGIPFRCTCRQRGARGGRPLGFEKAQFAPPTKKASNNDLKTISTCSNYRHPSAGRQHVSLVHPPNAPVSHSCHALAPPGLPISRHTRAVRAICTRPHTCSSVAFAPGLFSWGGWRCFPLMLDLCVIAHAYSGQDHKSIPAYSIRQPWHFSSLIMTTFLS